jgi:lysophospholipase L1-like esterase
VKLDRPYPQFFAYLGYVVFSLFATALLLELIVCTSTSAYRRIHPDRGLDPITSNPAFSRYSWAQDLHKEQKSRLAAQSRNYVPFRVWGLAEWHGNYMNNDATEFGVIRRTINPRRPECEGLPKTIIWMFGGSTLYGTGVPDSLTLPSFLSRELNTNHCFELINFGVEGYVNDQEVIVLEDELKAGHHPDIVIFYDGFNDGLVGTIDPGIPGAHIGYSAIKARLEGTTIGRLDFFRRSCTIQLAAATISKFFHRKVQIVNTDASLRAKAIATVEHFEQNLNIAMDLGKSRGFRVYGFWQPTVVYGRKPLSASEVLMVVASSDPATPFQAMIPVYEEAQRRAASAGKFVFLGNVFDAVQEPLYFDWVHLSPRGNELVAHAVAEYVTAHAEVTGQAERIAEGNDIGRHQVGVSMR